LKRHLIITSISYLFLSQTCEQARKKNPEWTIQQLRDALDAIVVSWNSPEESRIAMLQQAANRIAYHQRCNAAARQSHLKTTLARYLTQGIDPDAIPLCRWPKT